MGQWRRLAGLARAPASLRRQQLGTVAPATAAIPQSELPARAQVVIAGVSTLRLTWMPTVKLIKD